MTAPWRQGSPSEPFLPSRPQRCCMPRAGRRSVGSHGDHDDEAHKYAVGSLVEFNPGPHAGRQSRTLYHRSLTFLPKEPRNLVPIKSARDGHERIANESQLWLIAARDWPAALVRGADSRGWRLTSDLPTVERQSARPSLFQLENARSKSVDSSMMGPGGDSPDSGLLVQRARKVACARERGRRLAGSSTSSMIWPVLGARERGRSPELPMRVRKRSLQIAASSDPILRSRPRRQLFFISGSAPSFHENHIPTVQRIEA